jgi:hypothetical protein
MSTARRWVLIALVGSLCAAGVGCGGRGGGAGASPAGDITLTGALGEPRSWSVDGLASLPLQTQEVTFLGEGMQKTIRGRGVPLLDLLQRAKPKFDLKKKRDALRYAVLVHATDGYAAAIAWGEIDPDFAAKPVLVTVEENGQRLQRPGLIMPGDQHGGRHVYDIDRISLEALR